MSQEDREQELQRGFVGAFGFTPTKDPLLTRTRVVEQEVVRRVLEAFRSSLKLREEALRELLADGSFPKESLLIFLKTVGDREAGLIGVRSSVTNLESLAKEFGFAID